MNFIIIVLVFCFVIFLYISYFLSHDDFVILRTNTSMDRIFNSAFVAGLFSLFCARFFYVFLNPKPVFFSPLGFILFPYFPGLSLTGAVLGGYFITLFLLDSWNLPIGRIIDFFSIAFLSAFPFGFIGGYILSGEKIAMPFYLSIILFLVILVSFVKFILPLSSKGKLKDGSLSILFMSVFPLVYLLSNIIIGFGKNILTSENLISCLILISFVVVFIKKENIIERFIQKRQ